MLITLWAYDKVAYHMLKENMLKENFLPHGDWKVKERPQEDPGFQSPRAPGPVKMLLQLLTIFPQGCTP